MILSWSLSVFCLDTGDKLLITNSCRIYIQGKYIRVLAEVLSHFVESKKVLEKRFQVVLDEDHDTGVLAFMHEKTSLNKMQYDSNMIVK